MQKRIVLTVFTVLLFHNSAAILFAQPPLGSALKWNHDAVPSFREPVKNVASPVSLPSQTNRRLLARCRQ